MADALDKPAFGDFGIQNTMEMGMGNAELINDLMSPDTSTSDPDDIKPIIKEVIDDEKSKEVKVPKGKEIVPLEDGKEPTSQEVISNFLGDNETDEPEDIAPADNKSDEPVDKSTDDSTEPSPFTSLSKDLFKLGVFTKDEDETDEPVITSPEEFLERFNAEKKKGAIEVVNNFIGQFGEDYQNAFDAIFVKGVDPKNYFGVYNNIVDFTNLDLTVEENQVAVVKRMLTDQGMETEDITTEIDRLKNYGDLETVSGKYHKVLVKKEAAKLSQMQVTSEKELQQKANVRSQYIQNVQTILQEKLKTKEFDGIPINPKLVNELQDFLLIDKWKTPSGETLTDFDRVILDLKRPENHATKVKVALLLKIMEKDPTLSTIQRTGITKKSNELFGEFARQKETVKTKPATNQPTNSWFK